MHINPENFGQLESGMRVAISDGTKMPPPRHTSKLKAWRYRNTEGYIWGLDDESLTVELVSTKRELEKDAKIRVRMIQRFSIRKGFHITLLDA